MSYDPTYFELLYKKHLENLIERKQEYWRNMLLVSFIYKLVHCSMGSPTPQLNVCEKDGYSYCCYAFINKDGECVPCPAGSTGINCTLPCPFGYYGVFCKNKCECSREQICLPDIGCVERYFFPNSTYDNNTVRGHTAVGGTFNTLFLAIICGIIILVIAVFIVMHLVQRSLVCTDKFKFAPRICATKEDNENTPQNDENGLSGMDGILTLNQDGRHQSNLAIMDSAYDVVGDYDDGVSNEYNLLELRLRNVSCVSADFDRCENPDDYVSLSHEGYTKKADVEVVS